MSPGMKHQFKKIINKLKLYYGQPKPPQSSDPFELILLENIAYLADDARREAAFEELRNGIGLRPVDILAAPLEKLIGVSKLGGIHAEQRAQRLKESAQIVFNDFSGDLTTTLKLPLPQALKVLKQFPSIGEPGAEKILLFSKTYPILALESNGLRVLLRVGFGEEKKNYSASYKSVKLALQDQLGDDCEFLIRAHLLLRQHGKTICKTNRPLCESCPIASLCDYYQSTIGKRIIRTAS
jgi:endonuclease-3